MSTSFNQASRPSTAHGSEKGTVTVDVWDAPVGDEDAVLIYRWLDSLEFTRSRKTSSNRDFADGVMMAELVAQYIPKIINSTYYIPSSAIAKKVENWKNLNNKVFKRIGFQITPELIRELANARLGMIERVLKSVQPILFRGPRAVLPLVRKLENVKPRFLDYEKSHLKKNTEKTKVIEDPAPRASSRPRSAAAIPLSSSSRSRQRTPSRGKTSRAASAEAARSPSTRPQPARSKSPGEGRLVVSRENYDIFTRPSTGRSSDDAPLPIDFPTESNNLKGQPEDNNNNGYSQSVVLASKRTFPARSSWLPVDADAEKAVISSNRQNPDDEEADEEIYCDQSGYEEDTEGDEDNDGTETEDAEDGDTVFVPCSGDTTTKRPRRRLKRVVKYEYREEYILNGIAAFQLPNSQQLENVRKNYMSPGNRDPKCRGYGFV